MILELKDNNKINTFFQNLFKAIFFTTGVTLPIIEQGNYKEAFYIYSFILIVFIFGTKVYEIHYPHVEVSEDKLKIDDPIKIDLSDINKEKSRFKKKKVEIYLLSEPKRCPIKIDLRPYKQESVQEFKRAVNIWEI